MKWDVVVAALVKLWRDDTQLMAALGSGTIEPTESNVERRIPGMRYTVIAENEEEILNPIILQVDYWTLSRVKGVTLERRLRWLTVTRWPVTINDVAMWVFLDDSRDAPDPQPGVLHRQLDFRCVPVRAD